MAAGMSDDGSSIAESWHHMAVSKLASFGGSFTPSVGAATLISAATTLAAADSGKLFLVTPPASGTFDIKLPPLRDAVGATFSFMLVANCVGTVTLTVRSGGAVNGAATPLKGTVNNNGTIGVVPSSTAANQIMFGTGAKAGDCVDLVYGAYSDTDDVQNVVMVRGVTSASSSGLSTASVTAL